MWNGLLWPLREEAGFCQKRLLVPRAIARGGRSDRKTAAKDVDLVPTDENANVARDVPRKGVLLWRRPQDWTLTGLNVGDRTLNTLIGV